MEYKNDNEDYKNILSYNPGKKVVDVPVGEW